MWQLRLVFWADASGAFAAQLIVRSRSRVFVRFQPVNQCHPNELRSTHVHLGGYCRQSGFGRRIERHLGGLA